MKPITVKTLTQDGYHRITDEETAAKYEEIAPEMVKAWSFEPKPIRAGDVLKIDKALNNDTSLLRSDGRANPEAYAIARAVHMLAVGLAAWDYQSDSGVVLPITTENAETLPTDVLLAVANRVEFPKFATLEELAAAKNGSGETTKPT